MNIKYKLGLSLLALAVIGQSTNGVLPDQYTNNLYNNAIHKKNVLQKNEEITKKGTIYLNFAKKLFDQVTAKSLVLDDEKILSEKLINFFVKGNNYNIEKENYGLKKEIQNFFLKLSKQQVTENDLSNVLGFNITDRNRSVMDNSVFSIFLDDIKELQSDKDKKLLDSMLLKSLSNFNNVPENITVRCNDNNLINLSKDDIANFLNQNINKAVVERSNDRLELINDAKNFINKTTNFQKYLDILNIVHENNNIKTYTDLTEIKGFVDSFYKIHNYCKTIVNNNNEQQKKLSHDMRVAVDTVFESQVYNDIVSQRFVKSKTSVVPDLYNELTNEDLITLYNDTFSSNPIYKVLTVQDLDNSTDKKLYTLDKVISQDDNFVQNIGKRVLPSDIAGLESFFVKAFDGFKPDELGQRAHQLISDIKEYTKPSSNLSAEQKAALLKSFTSFMDKIYPTLKSAANDSIFSSDNDHVNIFNKPAKLGSLKEACRLIDANMNDISKALGGSINKPEEVQNEEKFKSIKDAKDIKAIKDALDKLSYTDNNDLILDLENFKDHPVDKDLLKKAFDNWNAHNQMHSIITNSLNDFASGKLEDEVKNIRDLKEYIKEFVDSYNQEVKETKIGKILISKDFFGIEKNKKLIEEIIKDLIDSKDLSKKDKKILQAYLKNPILEKGKEKSLRIKSTENKKLKNNRASKQRSKSTDDSKDGSKDDSRNKKKNKSQTKRSQNSDSKNKMTRNMRVKAKLLKSKSVDKKDSEEE